jgi:hypothetical protein
MVGDSIDDLGRDFFKLLLEQIIMSFGMKKDCLPAIVVSTEMLHLGFMCGYKSGLHK